jgi:hypothetical protein
MVELNLTQIPVRQRNLRRFAAPDPWRGRAPTEWDLNLYRFVIESQANAAEWAALKPKGGAHRARDAASDPLPGGRKLKAGEAIGLEPAGGGTYRLLPRPLVSAWQDGGVPETRLPDILAKLEPRLRRDDFLGARKIAGLWFVFGMAVVLGSAFLAGASWLMPSREQALTYTQTTVFLSRPAEERNVILSEGLTAHPIAAIDPAGLHPPPGFLLPQGLDTIGWYAAAEGQKRLILYTAHGSSALLPSAVAYGPVIQSARLGLDARQAAASVGADPVFIFVQRGGWKNGSDPTGMSQVPWFTPTVTAIFVLFAAWALFSILRIKRRARALRTEIGRLLQQPLTTSTPVTEPSR